MKGKRRSFAAAIFSFFRNIERHKAGLTENSMTIGNHRIVYLEGGQGEPILMLHGFGGEKDNWTKFASYFTKKYRVVAIDNPGFGNSTKIISEKYNLDTQVERIHEFAAKSGLGKFHIVGNSMGGMFAGAYAVKYPDQILSLGLFDSAGFKNRDKCEYEDLVRKGINPLVVESIEDYDRLMSFAFATPPKIPGFIKKYLAKVAYIHSDMNKKIFDEIIPDAEIDNRMKKIKAKTLVLWGDRDRVFPAANAHSAGKLIKNSEVAVIENCGHMPMMEKPEETAKIYLEFLASI